MIFENVEKYRIKKGSFSTQSGESFGAFLIPQKKIGKAPIRIICAPSDMEWQHVSVSLPDRCPTWAEMSKIKTLFWGEDVWVVQFHPPKSEYINNHPFCLHLWRWQGGQFPTPPSGLVGLKAMNLTR